MDVRKNPRNNIDASTSTDQLKDLPLCLFYFTHPFGVLSPEPPKITNVPENITKTFLNMKPIDINQWFTNTSIANSSNTTDEKSINIDQKTPNLNLSSSIDSYDDHRLTKLNKTPKVKSFNYTNTLWKDPFERKYKLLPPLERPTLKSLCKRNLTWMDGNVVPKSSGFLTPIDITNVDKPVGRKKQRKDIRKKLLELIHRNIKGKRGARTNIDDVLNIIRAAWMEPRPIEYSMLSDSSERENMKVTEDPLTPRPGASPGMFRRRYSVPETVMRKYKLAQHRIETDTSEPASVPSPVNSICAHRTARKDREQIRKSAILRRLCGTSGSSINCTECSRFHSDRDIFCSPTDSYSKGTHSLNGSRSELRHFVRINGTSSSNVEFTCPRNLRSFGSGWSTPKRIRVDSPVRKNDEMLRLAMKNSYERSEEIKATKKVCVVSLLATSDPRTESTLSNESIEDTVKILTNDNSLEDVNINQTNGNTEIEESLANRYVSLKPAINSKQNYELLEVIVSETVNNNSSQSNKNHDLLPMKVPSPRNNNQCMDLDQYVSNILVESLHSLTEQIEEVNNSMSNNNKITIVEKEIKVKLQNAGMNTIVHLSPNSNNTIIFGNEEIWHKEDEIDNGSIEETNRDNHNISQNINTGNHDGENDEEYTSKQNENVNQAVLHQIKKLFESDPNLNYSQISHIEISNLDVFVETAVQTNENEQENPIKTPSVTNNEIEIEKNSNRKYTQLENPVIVPRYSAMPNTTSMEVNASDGSDEDDVVISESTSLVDSLDDPRSPRVCVKEPRTELVRSSIDILDLLPESANSEKSSPREKGESFFIRIRDDSCDCEKENIIVADHMPQIIKERLLRRHKKRQLRMEHAKRKRMRQMKRDIERQRKLEKSKQRKLIEMDCLALLNSVIDEVVYKLAREEQNYARLKDRTNKSNENGKVGEIDNNINSNRPLKNQKSVKLDLNKHTRKTLSHCKENIKSDNKEQKIVNISHKSNIKTSSVDKHPKRIYQKSEIHDGKKSVEILEILEYETSSYSSSNSDESLNSKQNLKSRIPVPIYENIHKIPRIFDSPRKSTSVLSDIDKLHVRNRTGENTNLDYLSSVQTQTPSRRASIPQQDSRSRSNSSQRYIHTFEIIPEEKSSNDKFFGYSDQIIESQHKTKAIQTKTHKSYDDKTTSPLLKYINKNTATSPIKKLSVSSTTSPIKTLNKISTPEMLNELRNKVENVRKISSKTNLNGVNTMWNGFSRPKKLSLDEDLRIDGSDDKSVNISESSSSKENKFKKNKSFVRRPSKYNINVGGMSRKNQHVHSKNFRYYDTNELQPEAIKVNVEKKSEDIRKKMKDQFRLPSPFKKHPQAFKEIDDSVSSSESSSSSLLCSLAPKWLTLGQGKKHRSVRKKGSQDQQNQQSSKGGWTVTVAGNCFTTLPADVEMKLSFPKSQNTNNNTMTESVDEYKGFKGCTCKICDVGSKTGTETLLPTPRHKSMLIMKKESSGSSVQASKSIKKQKDSLPEVETNYKTRKTKSRSSVKMRRRFSLRCWLPEDIIPPIKKDDGLAVLGNAIIPEKKPRVPTMSERDITKHFTSRQFLR